MSLRDIYIKDTYSSSNDDLLFDFYNPVIEQAVKYDRITGFFSPAVLAIASRGFAGLISSEGKIRLISSVQLDERIYESVMKDGREFEDIILSNFNPEKIKSELDRDYLSVFAWLYRTGQLEMKVAVMSKEKSMLHQKIGIVTDANGNSLSFSGSNNETPNGWQYNIEQFKVFKSWNTFTESFYKSDEAEFETLWDNLSTKASIISLDEAIKNRLIQIIEKSRKGDIKSVINRIKNSEHINRIRIKPARGNDLKFQPDIDEIPREPVFKQGDKNVLGVRSLFDFQEEAIKHWFDNDYKAIFEMATGTGKTFTSINALKQFREKEGYLRALVVVPLTTLTIQWKNDIEEIIDDIQVINTSVDNKWRETLHSLNLSSKLGQSSDFIIITTYSMFPRNDFQDLINKLGEDFILVTDEMHNLVTELGTNAAKNIAYKYKLGLSATPTRLWKPEESSLVAKLFGDNRFSYDISKALKNKYLVPFNYYPIPVHLDIDEYEEYVRISREIGQMYAAKDSFDSRTPLNNKLIARARIKKNAESKLPALESLIHKLQVNKAMHHSLIYVDNEKFLKSLQIMLTRNNVLSTKFVGSTPLEERLNIINSLRTEGIKAIVAIKCLDEGVDIPSAQTAFFLSNNTDPREYVQRLGRVLRIDRAGDKKHADIYDYLVMPPLHIEYSDDQENTISRNLIKGELIRAKFFEELAINGDVSKSNISDATDEYGFQFEDCELEYNVNKED